MGDGRTGGFGLGPENDERDEWTGKMAEPEDAPPALPTRGAEYKCLVATDGSRVLMLDAPDEVFNFLNSINGNNYAEIWVDCPDDDPGVYSAVYRFDGTPGDEWREDDYGFDLVFASKLTLPSLPAGGSAI